MQKDALENFHFLCQWYDEVSDAGMGWDLLWVIDWSSWDILEGSQRILCPFSFKHHKFSSSHNSLRGIHHPSIHQERNFAQKPHNAI